MHALGIIVLWVAVQVTVIVGMVFLVLRLSGTSQPVWRSRLILVGIGSVFLLSALGVSPWPSWSEFLNPENASPKETTIAANETAVEIASSDPSDINESEPSTEVASNTQLAEMESPWSAAWSAFVDQMKKPQPSAVKEPRSPEPEAAATSISAFSLIGTAFLIGIALGLLRLLVGVWLLRREVARSRVIEDEGIHGAIQSILGSDAKGRPIEVRVTGKLRTAATTGILKPVILLPKSWESWSEEDLTAVLAHELNHIRRRDCLSTLAAELARVLHFYHPLVHWLANRLRLEQELAADASASRYLGGQKRYLCILAEMALAGDSRAPAWPARAFLPSHRTLIRRIEMLKKTRLDEARISRFWRTAAVCCLAAAAVFAVGLRGGSPSEAIAQDQEPNIPQNEAGNATEVVDEVADTEAARNTPAPFPLTYVPDDAIAVFGIRPKQLMSEPGLKPLVEMIQKSESTSKVAGVPLDQMEQVVLSFGMEDPTLAPMLISALVKSSAKFDLETLKRTILQGHEPKTEFYGGQLYLTEDGERGDAFWLADEYTLIWSHTKAGLKQAIDARNLAAGRKNRIPVWESVANQTAAGYVNFGLYRRSFEKKFESDLAEKLDVSRFGTPQVNFREFMGINPMFGPLWHDVETVVGHVSFDQGVKTEISARCSSNDGLKKVNETLAAMLVLGKNMIEQNAQMVGQLPKGEREMIGMLLKTGQEVLKDIELSARGNSVQLTASLPEDALNDIIKALVPAVIAAQDAAKGAQAKNQLKQIGIAMHNYHDVHKHFPMPVMMGPDGKTPHSWRVAILPYIDQEALYRQYRFEEPWDSEHNKKLLEKIPPVYRHPFDKSDSTSTSYFALTGMNTLMGDSKRNISFADVTDGNSNTLMIVESKTEVPWTKPVDLPFSRSNALPKLGGFTKDQFLALFGDGSVRFIDQKIDKSVLYLLIQRNDGQPINDSEYDGSRRRGSGSGASSRGGSATPPGDFDRSGEAGFEAGGSSSTNPEPGGEFGASDGAGSTPGFGRKPE